jgi:hypothetical protein
MGFDPQGRKVGFFEGLLQVAGAIAIADWLFSGSEVKPSRGGIGVDHSDVFGYDYTSIFDSEGARDEYYRRMRQGRYESGHYSG